MGRMEEQGHVILKMRMVPGLKGGWTMERKAEEVLGEGCRTGRLLERYRSPK